MTKEEFARLKAGDVVIRYGKPSLVLDGPANKLNPPIGRSGEPHFVTVTLLRRSWCRRWSGVFGYHDIKNNIRPYHGDKEVAVRLILQLSSELGFNLDRELDRTITEMETYKTRFLHLETNAVQYLKYLRLRMQGEQRAA